MKDRLADIYGVRYKVQLHGPDDFYMEYSLKDTAIKRCFFGTLDNFGNEKFYFLLDDGSMAIIPYKDVLFMAPAKEQEVKNEN